MALPGITHHDMTLAEAFPDAVGGLGRHTVSFPLAMVALQAQAVLVLNYAFGFRGRILSTRWVTTQAGSAGDDALIAFTLDTLPMLPTTPVSTGGLLTLTTALTPAGSVCAGAAITGRNTFDEHTNLTLTCPTAASPFTAGAGVVEVLVENLDELEALATYGLLASE